MEQHPETDRPAPPAPRAGRARSLRSPAALTAGLIVLAAVLALVALLSLWVGARDLPAATTWRLLWHPDASDEALIVHGYRIPRVLLGTAVGVALGLSGALTQALTRNPLGDPALLGVSMGASTGVVVAIAFVGVSGYTGYVWFALLGAVTASVAVYVIGTAGHGRAAPERLILVGAAFTAVLGAFNTGVLMLDPNAFDEFRFWNVGSLAGRYHDVLWPMLPFVGAGVLLALGLARPLNTLALGDDLGIALGARVARTRLLTALAVMLLCGAATAAAGPIAFVGLAVPHAARILVGPDQRWVLAYSTLLAPILLLASDIVGRLLGAPGELQVGIVTAFLGAPVFIALCRRRRLVDP
ncbi:iron chelate uptake ABC transporter family permease subunit [Nocardiopsis sp. NPDC049922]|uniref:FecCD family ABC transporter permease n=1 Tax=Nocardiopsis sp. NPDC049922 TaxID=3155157 RepID=UPI0033F9837F